ncbi:MAG: TrkA C-terminal domain-containing protein [Bryobacteraceae bacterium]
MVPVEHVIGKRIMDIRLPKSALVVLVSRDNDFIAPRGGTVLQKGDRMLVLAEKDDFGEVRSMVKGDGEEEGPNA